MNQMVRTPPIGTRDGDWVWDGSRWVCSPDDCPPVNSALPVPCPPLGPPVFSGPAGQPPWYPGANGAVSFSQTAPPNPVRGHFWFDGITLWLFDGATWVGVAMSNTSMGNGTTPAVTVPSGPNPPFAPTVGALWFNGTTLFVWDGSTWVPATQTKTFLQGGQPVVAAPGDLWWDGTQLHLYDGTTWTIIGPQAPPPVVPSLTTSTVVFAMQQPGPVACGAAWGVIPYSSPPQVDLQAAWDPATHRFTPKQAGLYYCSLRCVTAGAGVIAIVKNDTNDFSGVLSSDIVVGTDANTGATWVTCDGIAQMNGTSDFIRPWAKQTTGTQLQAAGSNPIFGATKLA